jgi:hypothetical protein
MKNKKLATLGRKTNLHPMPVVRTGVCAGNNSSDNCSDCYLGLKTCTWEVPGGGIVHETRKC